MAIETTEFSKISIAVSPIGVPSGNFGILGFLTNETGTISTAERSRAYTSLASLGKDWNSDTEVYKAATAFYGQTPTPTDFVVIVAFETDQAAVLTGGGHKTLGELVIIDGNPNGGNLSITIDSTDITIDNLDLSSATTFAEIATAIESAITSANSDSAIASVTYNGYSFEIRSLVTGADSEISFADGETGDGSINAAEYLGLEQHQGKISIGIVAESPVQALTVAHSSGVDFTGLDIHKDYRDKIGRTDSDTDYNTKDIAIWAEAAKKIFCNTTNIPSAKTNSTTDIGSELKDLTLKNSLTTYSSNKSMYPSSSVFGRAASVNFSGIGTVITLNLKQMPGIKAEDLSPGEYAILKSKNISAVVKIGKTVNAYANSRMASGSWLDTTHGLLWLENRIGVDMFNLLYQTNTKIPYTETGISFAVATLAKSLQTAVDNGLAAPGFLLDGTFLPDGYRINSVAIGNVPSSDSSNRLYNGLSFDMVGAGALHELNVSGSFKE